MDRPTDAELIGRSLGDPEAFAAIFDRHAATLLGYCHRRLDRATAEDILGEAFRIAFETRHRFDRSRDSALPWLYGITANLIMKDQRRGGRRGRALDRLQVVAGAPAGAPFDEELAQHTANLELLAAVESYLCTLAPGDREVVVLYAWQGLGYDAIAEAMDIPVGTVRSRLNRVRAALRELRRDIGEEVGVPSRRAPGGV